MTKLSLLKITENYFLDNKMKEEKQLFEDVKKRLSMICDYDPKKGLSEMTLFPSTVDEDDNNPDEQGGDAPAPGGDTGAAPAGPNMGGGMPPMDTNAGGAPADPNMGGGMPPMDPNAGGAPMDPNAAPADGGAQTPEGFNPQGDLSADSFNTPAGDTEQPGDEVLDVTELTDKQDDIEKEIHEVGGKFDEVLKAIGSFEELIRANDEKLEDLRAEIERRNPTQIEKLGNQKSLSYPFNVSPEEYWKEKEATSNYSTEDDDNGKEQGQYVITADDVNGDTNWQAIAKSLEDKDFLYNQTLDKLLKF